MLYYDEVTFIDFLKVSFYFFLFVFKNFSKTLFQRRSLRFVYQTFKVAGFRFRVSARLLNSQASDLPCAAVGHVFREIPSLKAALRMLSPNGEKIPPSKFNFLFFENKSDCLSAVVWPQEFCEKNWVWLYNLCFY